MSLLERVTSGEGVVFYRSPLLHAAGVPHGFSTRIGGMSAPPFDTLNLGSPAGADLALAEQQIQDNYRRFARALGLDGRRRAWVHQVHGAEVVDAADASGNGPARRADGLVSDDARVALAVRAADCVPILLAQPRRNRVAAVHAGWRGLVAGVLPAALRRLGDGEPILAAIGPCISQAAFEVGPEVVASFERLFGADAPILADAGERARIDLRAAARLQLVAGGVAAAHIDVSDRCTVRDADEFFSHRRLGDSTGKMAAMIGAVARAGGGAS